MKGVVFREFLGMVDMIFSPDVTERIIADSALPSGGAYTSVGTYDHSEIITLVAALSKETGRGTSELVHAFGFFLFGRFRETHPAFFAGVSDAYDFLESVDGYIHAEVRTLYPNAELPRLDCHREGDNILIFNYESARGMGDLAHGLIAACVEYFGQPTAINRQDLSGGPTQRVRFELTRTGD